ncbi:hypothetical protein QE152_g13476 [Popillia japonica]|uniref:Uncharacterized protein n=1 Tax=Popillia japonica TaxID=7064 RepID=A0AAW1LBP1_POPJA
MPRFSDSNNTKQDTSQSKGIKRCTDTNEDTRFKMCDISCVRKFLLVVLVTRTSIVNCQVDVSTYDDRATVDRIQDINGNFVRGVPYNVDTERDRQRIDDRNRQIFRGNIEQLLQNLDVQSSQQCTNNVGAQWNFETNVNQVTQLDALNAQQLYSDFQHSVWEFFAKVP